YVGDTVGGESEGAATITVTISHDATTPQVVTDTATITDPNVAATGGNSYTVQEGTATLNNVLLATFTDPGNPSPGNHEDTGDYSASVTWGDGTSADTTGANVTIVNNNDGTWSVFGTHTYVGDTVGGESEGAATITVTISHDATTPQVVTDTATITDPNVAATGGNSYTVQEGTATLNNVLLATFTDPGNPSPGNHEDAGDYSASVTWGDGTSDSTTGANVTIVNNNNGTWSVFGTHTYVGDTVGGESEGAATITVTISHDATTPQVVTDTATITDPNVAATGGNSYTVQEGTATLNNVLLA